MNVEEVVTGERLLKKAPGAGGQALVDCVLGSQRGDHHDARLRIDGEDLREGLDPRLTGHDQIEQHDVGPDLLESSAPPGGRPARMRRR